MAEVLLDAGAAVDAENMLNETPLHVACCFTNEEVVRLLLDRNAAANA